MGFDLSIRMFSKPVKIIEQKVYKEETIEDYRC